MRGRIGRLVLLLLAFAATASAQQHTSPSRARAAVRGDEGVWTEVEADEMDVRALGDHGRKALGLSDANWKHAQTDHFVIHYEQAIFARKVARMAEFFYAYIADDLQGVKDKVNGRSHIFIFRTPRRWQEMRAAMGDMPEWTFSLVAGTVMLLQQADDTSRSGDILAHEMTHLVVNRFFTGPLPLWLNEGLAEYYEEFAYSAMKGVKKSKRTQFRRLANPYPLPALFNASTYPADPREVRQFYETAKFMAGFLLLAQDKSRFLPFLEDILKGEDIGRMFSRHYGLTSMDEIEKAFGRFAN